MIKIFYSVWVGGVEVHDHLLTRREAERLEQKYIDQGYQDTGITIYT